MNKAIYIVIASVCGAALGGGLHDGDGGVHRRRQIALHDPRGLE